MPPDPKAAEVGNLAMRLATGYYAHLAAIQVAADPRAEELCPPPQPGISTSVAPVMRKDGTAHVFDFRYHLRLVRSDRHIAGDLERIWLTGALLNVGDALAQNDYFDRAPVIELLRHLRNGVAHGNRFNIVDRKGLARYPAHNRDARVRGGLKPVFEISEACHDSPVLFDFMGPADVLDAIRSVGLHLLSPPSRTS